MANIKDLQTNKHCLTQTVIQADKQRKNYIPPSLRSVDAGGIKNYNKGNNELEYCCLYVTFNNAVYHF